MSADPIQTVRRRRVFYIPGYDPIHPRRYRELYRTEGAEQAAISGYDLALKPKGQKGGRYGWHVDAQIEGAQIETRFDVLVWSDIVRASMETGILGTYRQLFSTAWTYIGSGALRRLMKLRIGPVIAALYPIVFLLVQAMLACAAAGLIGWGLSWITPWLAPLGLAVVPVILTWFRKNDHRFYAYYLMHDYAYSAQSKGAIPPELAARMAEFTDEIAAVIAADEVDEVLVVGHSSGAHLAVSIFADLLRDNRIATDGPVVGFLSLGQVVPMVSFLPDAWQLRRDLRVLGSSQDLAWVDVTAPGDGCSFALCDPVAVSGVAAPDQSAPLVFSAAFTQTLSDEKMATLERRYFRLHFQYLCAFDRPKDYDYFQITAGPMTLKDRYKNRPASRSTKRA
ncbi:MAG: hypothetical protein AAF386_09350, partial [Pseudomonadota bacterium]